MAKRQTSGLSDVERKWKVLVADKRTYAKRLLLSGAAMLGACFTFLFFGPVEMVAFSGDFLTYSYRDILGLMAFAAVAVCAVGAAVLALIKGRLFNYLVTFVFAATVGGYLQALLFNGSLGSLNGDAISWDLMKGDLFVNLFAWAIVFLACYLILYFSREVWKKMVLFGAVLLVTMQSAPLLGIVTGAYADTHASAISEYAFSEQGMYEFSSEDNILVFVLDRMDFDFIESALKEDPAILDGLDGFTGYSNAVSRYSRTKPALNHILTGSDVPAYTVTDAQYLKDSWTSDGKNILEDLAAQGYSMEMYASIQDLFSDPEYVTRYVSNVTTSKGDIHAAMMLRKMLYLSAYRYLPLALKPFFWADTNFYNSQIYLNSEIYEMDDARYAPGFRNSAVCREQSCFKFYHFNGPHEPFVLNADGTRSDHYTTAEEQMMGTLNNLYAAFDKLKEQDVYKDMAIIITADHGNAVHDDIPLTKATRIGLFYKPSGSAGAPLVWSSAPVSTENIAATIVREAGADESGYGVALSDVAEDAAIIRQYFKSVNEGKADAAVYRYEIIGDAADYKNWVETEILEMKYDFY